MHIAIAVGTLLLGGWVLNSPVDEDESAVQEPSRPSGTTPAVLPSRSDVMPDRSDIQDRDNGRAGRSGGGQAGGRSMAGGQTGRTQQQQPQRQGPVGMPSSPTDPMSAGADGMAGQPTSPTSGVAPGQGSGSGTGGMQSFGSRQPTAPTERYGSQMQSAFRPTSNNMTDPSRRMPALSSPAVTAPPVTEKAFSGYRAPSGVSPYMNLFRPTAGGVDNYTTLVRPELDQRYLNHQLGNDIRGLQNNTRTQGMNLQQLNKDARTLQGVGTPQYYQNYGNYYQYGQ